MKATRKLGAGESPEARERQHDVGPTEEKRVSPPPPSPVKEIRATTEVELECRDYHLLKVW